MNAARFTDSIAPDTDSTAPEPVGARAILAVPDPGSPSGGLVLMASDQRSEHGVPEQPPTGPGPSEGMPAARTAVLRPDVESGLRDRWTQLRQSFADDPRGGLQDADALLQDLSGAFAEAVEEHRARLAAQWQVGRPEAVQLEEALRQYDELVRVLLGQR